MSRCVFAPLVMVALLSMPPSQPEPMSQWIPVTPGLSTGHGADLTEYDDSCIARIEHGVVTMVACPDGRVAWFD